MTDSLDPPLHVDPAQPIGSPRLAAALATGDADAIGRALRADVVVVPLLGASGTKQIRVFEIPGVGMQLALFSSSETFERFLAGDAETQFDLPRGTALAPFLEQHRNLLARVVFDPAGPHPVVAPVDAVIEALRPRPDDDDVAWITGAPLDSGPASTPTDSQRSTEVAIDFRLSVPWTGWLRVVPADVVQHPDRTTTQMRRRLKRLPSATRAPVGEWIAHRAISVARQSDTREIGLRVDGSEGEAVVVLLTRRWRPLSAFPDDDFASVLARLAAGEGSESRLEALDAGGDVQPLGAEQGSILRHLHDVDEPMVPSGRIALVDYWLPFPDGAGWCVVSFATPEPARRADVVRLTVGIVSGGSWVMKRSG